MADIEITLDIAKEIINDNPDQPIFVWGPPGIGKSEMVAEIARSLSIGFIDARASQLDSTDLRGLPWVDKDFNVSRWAQAGFLPLEERDGPVGILFCDELNLAPPLTQASFYQLINDRAVGEYRLPDGWRVIAAGNRVGDRGSVYRMAAPLANRFLHLHCVPDVSIWRNWAIAADVDSRIIAFIQFKELSALFNFNAESDAEAAFATPRTWYKASRIVKRRLAAKSDERMPIGVFAAIAGLVGSGLANEFAAFVRITDALPDIEKILLGKIFPAPPKKLDLLHATTTALVTKLQSLFRSEDAETFETCVFNGMNYLGKMPAEFIVLAISDLTKLQDMARIISKNAEYRKLVGAYAHLIVSVA